MNTDLLMLKAQFNAFRNLFVGLLPRIDGGDTNTVWFHKYRLWEFERSFLSFVPSEKTDQQLSLGKEKLDRRCFQLQVLMDIAYLQGHLEQFDLIRRISPDAYNIAVEVYQESDGLEEAMLPLIDKHF